MAIHYALWLQLTGRRGTEADALVWKKTHGVALGLYNPDGSRREAATPAAATPAAPPDLGPPVDPQTSDIRFAPLNAQLQNIPGTFNDTRRTDANLTLKDLIDAGLLDTSSALGQEEKGSGVKRKDESEIANIVYHIVRGADGQQYLQGFRSVLGSQASRGWLESSQTDRRQQETRAGYDKQVSDAFLNLGRGQQSSLTQEESDITGVGTQIGDLRGTIAGEQAAAPAPVPPAPSAPPTPNTANLPPTLQSPAAFAQWLAGQGIHITGAAFRDRYWRARQAHGAPVPGAPTF